MRDGWPTAESEALLLGMPDRGESSDRGLISTDTAEGSSSGGGSPAVRPPDGAPPDVDRLEQLDESYGDSDGRAPAGPRSGHFTDPFGQVMSLLKPVSLTMALCVFLVNQMAAATQEMAGAFSGLMVYQEQATDDAGTIFGGVLLNGLVVVLMLAFVTSALVLLYKYRCYKVIYAWLFFSVASMLGVFGGYVVEQLLTLHDIPVDSITFYFVLYNFSAVGTLMIFWTEYGCGPHPPLLYQQGYLVFISALLAWSATKLPEWTTFGLLASVSVWDLIAVLTPRGPLKVLVELAEERDEPIPGLVYQGADIKLGLGDFIFYSVLVGRASMQGIATMVAVALAVIAGLCATLALLPILQKVLPALPISIAMGLLFYFSTEELLVPMANELSMRSIWL